MFPTPKPRRFTYRPRFYDPEKERLEAIRLRHADQAEADIAAPPIADSTTDTLEYFEQRVRELDSADRKRNHKLTWRDMFRKREMPTFNYQPRFSGETNNESTNKSDQYKRRTTKIKRRFDITDAEYFKPVPAGKIMLYTLLVCLLLYWIVF